MERKKTIKRQQLEEWLGNRIADNRDNYYATQKIVYLAKAQAYEEVLEEIKRAE